MFTRVQSFIVVLLACILVSLAACGPKTPPNLDPHAQAVFKATVAIDKLTTATNVIIALNKPGVSTPAVIPDRIEVILLTIIKSVSNVIAATPDGWLTAARTAFMEGEKALTPAEQAQYAGYLLIIDTVLTAAG